MSSPEKKRKATTTKKPSLKRKKKKLPPQLTSIHSLPDDVLLTCLARVSRLHYPTLSLVSKSFQSLLASPELHKTRSSLGRTETCLYVCFRSLGEPDPNPRWFTLCLKPEKKKKKKKSSGNVLVPTSVPCSAPAHWSGLVAIPSVKNIYYIGGPIEHAPLSSPEAPRMWVERCKPVVNVLDRKVYVTRGGRDREDSDVEIFNPKTKTYEIWDYNMTLQAVVDKKVYMFGLTNGLSYIPKEGQWERLWGQKSSWGWFSFCVIENVLYHYRSGVFKWHDTKGGCWIELKGLTGLPKFESYGCVQLADYGGKMAVLWSELVLTSNDCKNMMIWCAVIALERRNGEEIWGNVEWCDVVLTVPNSSKLEYALAATV
ncbi:F-box domain [Arabidopsis thaliana x Arabidopsis arenosa]|uniref:F-box domain n=1 Tax=Arabidopsis thaliana x Arabidopsis arenosa TaxID=1240361 RepID=A0A8T1XIK1_9BRAS|nr:F-box domain [Arabidopsis thaliana x Arabidopsis arenosa]